mmetsp:Transcript_78905/g.231597  ORF Transcript_78905/g.231597 Transcript_78905/m.231597 type:complete len:201 (-) Transcript_78905:958-1560(-)
MDSPPKVPPRLSMLQIIMSTSASVTSALHCLESFFWPVFVSSRIGLGPMLPVSRELPTAIARSTALSLGRVARPTQQPARTTGKMETWFSTSALRTCSTEASSGSTALAGSSSHRSAAAAPRCSTILGISGSRKGTPFISMSRSSKEAPEAESATRCEMKTASISGGIRCRSLAHSIMKTTMASVCRVKAESIEALPTTA